MKKVLVMLLIAFVLGFGAVSFGPATTAFAAVGQPPVGSCAPGFVEHTVMMHEHHDHHIGLKVDLNRDNLVCVRHLSNGLHVHVDNVIR